ncbi:DUF5058 family protein [Vallitalea guaymasensis]|uniref:DUF5058 family protein n=1 Tax=Vallitalea guaymasensis TaxID=1185412 RepID=A0A8J8SD31_9FIRM|nr:DUF5058 family protein [Vallitalea guaymasensis]QUH30473.1 DUF5058 family protein [Vallitalea guaymasensis]
MKDYMEIANSNIIFILAAVLILFVLIQCVVFLVISWKRGIAIGMSKEKMMSAVKSSAIFSIVPSIPIIISLIAIAPVLGIPFSWMRLSIVGSAPYELISADIGAKSMGVAKLGAEGYTSLVFGNSMWIMSIGIIWGLLFCIIGLKWYQNKMKNIQKKDSNWLAILINALFFGMLSVFIGPPIVEGGVALLVLLSSGIIMTLLTFIGNKFKLDWINNFSLAVSMLCGMILAVVYTGIL